MGGHGRGLTISVIGILLHSFVFFFCSVSLFSDAATMIKQGEEIRVGDTIVSENGRFVLGFFNLTGNSASWYVGIWYDKIPSLKVIWVANRETPVVGAGGVLTLEEGGNLMVLDGNRVPVWQTNSSVSSNNSTAVLLDTGNLILSGRERINDVEKTLWESFRDPTDSYLPDMKVYLEAQEDKHQIFSSWKSPNDPSPGNFSMGVDPRGSPQIVIWEGRNRRWRSGHWNGVSFIGVPNIASNYLFGFHLRTEDDGRSYFTYKPPDPSELIIFSIDGDGIERQERWDEDRKEWVVRQSEPTTVCDFYNKCGNFGLCSNQKSPICSCIEGFVPKDRDQWDQGNWSGGCVRRKVLQCVKNASFVGEGDDFVEVKRVKLPDLLDYVGRDTSQDMKMCEERCLRNCSCEAFAFVNGLSCMIWSDPLVDVQKFEEDGYTLYVRLDESEFSGRGKVTKRVIIAVVVAGAFFLIVAIWLLWRWCSRCLKASSSSPNDNNQVPQSYPSRSGEYSTDLSGPGELYIEVQPGTGKELALYSFSCVAAATDNFSDGKKLGQGGFGPVYKGELPGGEEIAVKRLSKRSGQGLEEFKNEIILIAQLQHRNLVRLLGCCIEGEERMLIYEYMLNKSLDSYLFDSAKQVELDWTKRLSIIEGIARGLLYLHRDSRLRIIHRDLKASNILLDGEMNPKISDFGMARIFGGNQNEANTNRVVGTYGYMSPEYAMEGLFSVKSDVYSFGILLLEIVSGRRNSSFRLHDHSSIAGYAWDLWEAGKSMDLTDPAIVGSCRPDEVSRCIHVGMLCVQDMAVHRPDMCSVLVMLRSDSTVLPMPRPPTFASMRRSVEGDFVNESQEHLSLNGVTVTMLIGR